MKDAAKLKDTVKKVDFDFSRAGYKTLGVVVKVSDCLTEMVDMNDLINIFSTSSFHHPLIIFILCMPYNISDQ